MPNVTTYIRKDDMELWAACPNKAELIHNALHNKPFGDPKNVDWSKAVNLPLEQYETVTELKDGKMWTGKRYNAFVEPEKILEPRVKPDTVTVPRIETAPPSYKQPNTKVPNPFDETKGVPNTSETTFVPKSPDPELGYPCCQKKTPCKHWQWDSGQEAYVNTLTGLLKEPTV